MSKFFNVKLCEFCEYESYESVRLYDLELLELLELELQLASRKRFTCLARTISGHAVDVDDVDVGETGIAMDSRRPSVTTTSMRQAAESLATSAATSPETRTIWMEKSPHFVHFGPQKMTHSNSYCERSERLWKVYQVCPFHELLWNVLDRVGRRRWRRFLRTRAATKALLAVAVWVNLRRCLCRSRCRWEYISHCWQGIIWLPYTRKPAHKCWYGMIWAVSVCSWSASVVRNPTGAKSCNLR